MRKIAITGSAGFVGSHLLSILEKDNNVELILMDIQSGIDICDWNQIKDIKADVFIHLANKSYVPDSYKYPLDFYNVNINSTLNILELARINNAKLIYLSSYIYGHPQYLPIDEKHPVSAFNPYAQTKAICESLCEGYSRDFNMPIIIFRPFNIYGKGQNSQFLIPAIIQQIKNNEKIVIKDDRPKRDYIHVSDVVQAICLAMDYIMKSDGLEIYNLGSGISYSVKDVVNVLFELTNTKADYHVSNERRPNEILDTIADVSKIKEKMNWKPEISIIEGLKQCI